MPHILVVDDEAEIRDLAEAALKKDGHTVKTATTQAEAERFVRNLGQLDVVLTDLRIGEDDGLEVCQSVLDIRPDVPVIVMTGYTSMDAAIGALRAGAWDFLPKPLELEPLRAAIRRATQHRALSQEVKRLRREVDGPVAEFDMVGRSPSMRRVFDLIERVGDSDATVLVTGESGTGKELVARALHRQSGREGRFVAVNCAAMPANLLESELFGHVRGAFTDAKRSREGLFIEADGGTLFLDEIGEMAPEMQAKLLRALQERKVRPVGSSQERAFDTRIIAATNRDLEDDVAEDRFREDLFYRINVVNVHLPPLRARGHDILRLAQRFVEDNAERMGRDVKGLSEPAAERLLAYDWPGNVRELENCIERAVTLARFEQITTDDLPERVRTHESSRLLVDTQDPSELPTLETLERRFVRKVLQVVGGNKTQAAKVLGIDRRTLYRKLARWEKQDKKAREREAQREQSSDDVLRSAGLG
ncbi:MAG TPA: sigma-54 dependent transcriptional regulator [Polyangiaceae bacterium LLY-WYZ-15_(1-7)]|nr:Fis family transcriptional regulator [Myxococcales bacterium]MAT28718.1 Fis family transcriptional regulator [Sandaracinus sp.]HJK90772.1 sigma-54 dependent transcriptional regulator [Polyangiaceae bacterium LLY-WYZ-15_(1-7)]MBJ69843.1 Fis family transcriptional regulator [Sandaracinus sp.]HJL02200.1 sigma-54 dependent transcriptional regulator [Polyangiaceae bacterium LLY-WYZ-15_(1-7)]